MDSDRERLQGQVPTSWPQLGEATFKIRADDSRVKRGLKIAELKMRHTKEVQALSDTIAQQQRHIYSLYGSFVVWLLLAFAAGFLAGHWLW